MNKFGVCAVLVAGISVSMPGWAGLFSSCDEGSRAPMPDWVSETDYSLKDFYAGVGSAEKEGRSTDEQRQASENDAKAHLVEQIEVTIKAENRQSTRVSDERVEKIAQSQVTASAVEVLRDLKIKSRWVDKETCRHYTLMVISKESIAQAKRERIMRDRLEKFKVLLEEGTDREKNRDVKVRHKYLEDARALLGDTDFRGLDELGKEVYAKRMNDALDQLNKESSRAKGRMALFALNKDGSLNAGVIEKMLGQLRSADNTTDRLMAGCNRKEDCIRLAKERGFAMLTLLDASSQVATGLAGSFKGTLTVSRTVYDIESGNVLKGPDTASAQVIGWGREELDWATAAAKAMQTFK